MAKKKKVSRRRQGDAKSKAKKTPKKSKTPRKTRAKRRATPKKKRVGKASTRSKKSSRKRKKVSRTRRKPRVHPSRKHDIRGVVTAPEGFEDIPERSHDEAMATIRERLERAIEFGRVRVWPYADGSVDGEILAHLPRGRSANDVLMDLEESIGRDALDGFWVSVGVRYTIKEDEEVYRRYKGMNDVNTHYQRALATNVAEVFVVARHEIAAGMEAKYGRKPDSVYVRFHWNPFNMKPPQREIDVVEHGGKGEPQKED